MFSVDNSKRNGDSHYMTLTMMTKSTPNTAINNIRSASHDGSETSSSGLLALVYHACSAMMSGFALFCLVASVKNKATHEGRNFAVPQSSGAVGQLQLDLSVKPLCQTKWQEQYSTGATSSIP